jgi:hypothetical protein
VDLKMVVEPVAATLASLGLFLQLYDTCDRLYHGFKLTRRFGEDFENTQIQLDAQWARLDTLWNRRRVRRDMIDLGVSNDYVIETLKRLLELMKRYFAECNRLMEWYDGESKKTGNDAFEELTL